MSARIPVAPQNSRTSRRIHLKFPIRFRSLDRPDAVLRGTTTDGIANMIRTGSVEMIPSAIQTGAKYKMHTFSSSLEQLWKAGYLDQETVREHS